MYVEPERARYGTLVPEGTRTEPLLRFREACERSGLRFRAWVVGLHNGELAAAHPDAAARLLDGSPAGHSLCPSAPEAVEYVAALAGDVAAQLEPEYVDLEAAFYPAWEPSYTLTLALEPLSEQARLLCRSASARRAASCSERTWRRARTPPSRVSVEELADGRAAGARAPRRGGRGSRARAGQPPPRLRLRPAGAGGAPGRLARVGRRRRRAPLRLRPASRRRADRALRRAARARRPPRRGLDELDARAHGARGRRRAARGGRRRGPRALQPLARPGGGARGVPGGRARLPRGRWPHDGDRRPRHARPRAGRVSDRGGAARDDGPARDRARARLAGRGLPAGAEPRGERARRSGRRLVGRAAARLRGRDAVARRRGARGAEACAGCRSRCAEARLRASGLRPPRRPGRAARRVRGRVRLARLRPHGHAAARAAAPARVARGALPRGQLPARQGGRDRLLPRRPGDARGRAERLRRQRLRRVADRARGGRPGRHGAGACSSPPTRRSATRRSSSPASPRRRTGRRSATRSSAARSRACSGCDRARAAATPSSSTRRCARSVSTRTR